MTLSFKFDIRRASRTDHIHAEDVETRETGRFGSTTASRTNHAHTEDAARRKIGQPDFMGH